MPARPSAPLGSSAQWPRDLDADDLTALSMFARAASRASVARELGCSTATLDRRTQRLKTALDVETLTQVIVRAVRDDLI